MPLGICAVCLAQPTVNTGNSTQLSGGHKGWCEADCACAVSAPSTYAQVPGGAGRWTLPDVSTGLDSMADMYTQADKMANEMTLYTTLQGITMQLLILRLIKVLSAQKRLSILTTTAMKVCCCVWSLPLTNFAVSSMLHSWMASHMLTACSYRISGMLHLITISAEVHIKPNCCQLMQAHN